MLPGRFERYELKYFVSLAEADAVRTMIAPFVRPDDFAASRPGYAYTVRSIYYDTPDLRFYFEKDAGLKVRKKLRLRTYNGLGADSVASLEIKRKYGAMIRKERVILPLDCGTQVLVQRRPALVPMQLSTASRYSLERFLVLMESLRLRATVLITYEREAYVGRDDPRVRVTFDKDVRSLPRPEIRDLHANQGFRRLTDRRHVLELKFDGAMPPWLRPVTAKLDRSYRPISKYCRGIDLWGLAESRR